jgi:hypothetical protein
MCAMLKKFAQAECSMAQWPQAAMGLEKNKASEWDFEQSVQYKFNHEDCYSLKYMSEALYYLFAILSCGYTLQDHFRGMRDMKGCLKI